MDDKNNAGNCNTGDRNTGYRNTGDRNTGNWNTGNWNTGDCNTGDCNTGECNTGDCNTGECNTGDCNTGNWNTGYRNTGDRNTGNWNTGNWNTGDFNTITPDNILVFNKPFSRKEWNNFPKPELLYFSVTEWISDSEMTDKEKIDNPTFHTTGGYLKKYEYKEAFQKSWNKASKEDQEAVTKLPNFDAEVFFEISGIDVRKKTVTCDGKVVEIDGKKYKLVEQ